MNFTPRHLHSVAPEKDLGGEHVFPGADRKFMEFIPVVFQIAADRPPTEKFPVEIQIVAAVRTDQQTETRRRFPIKSPSEQRIIRFPSGHPAPGPAQRSKIVHHLFPLSSCFFHYT